MTARLSYLLITVADIELKISLLVISEILCLFVSTLTAGEKYSRPNSENLLQPNQMRLSKKPEKCS